MGNFKHKKSLGQNFLKNQNVIDKIVSHASVKDRCVVEIGPGEGVLTEALAQKAQRVVAIELDDRLIDALKSRFKKYENVIIVHDDVLHMNIEEIVKKYSTDFEYDVVANIPYYITAPIIRLFLETKNKPREIILMVQKEVAERLSAQPGQMSVLAVSAQYYADVEYLFSVPREDFEPVPNVDSAVVKLKIKDKQQELLSNKNFFQIVKIGFSAKRKTLANNLANGLQIDKKEIERILEQQGLGSSARAQELSIQDWKNLQKAFKFSDQKEIENLL